MRVKTTMDAVVLAGGKGTRLKSVVKDRPKPMAEVAGRPFLEWQLLYLRSLGITRVILCTGYKAKSVEVYFKTGSEIGMQIIYSREKSPLGTAGAVIKALTQIKTDPFLVLNGDSLCPFDPRSLNEIQEELEALVTMVLVGVDDCSRFGSVKLDADNYVTSFNEKQPSCNKGLINAGIYLMKRSLLEGRDPTGFFSLESDLFPNLPPHSISGFLSEGPFIDIGTPESLSIASDFVADHFKLTSAIFGKEKR